jgi:TP901 family phage tail tape measure protein
LAASARDVETFDKRVSNSSDGLSKFTKAASLAAKAGVLVLAAAFAASVASAVQFETRMRNVNSISHLSEQAFRAQNKAVLEMSKTFPQSANILAEGLYDIASSGFQGAKGLEVLKNSAMAASAGMSDTATSARAITAVLNAYGLGAEQAERVSNVLFEGVNVGVMSFDELASSIGNSVGTAAAAKVSIEELTGGIATMTLSGLSAAEASTSMNRTMQGLIDPSDALASAINALGYESGAQMLEVEGLHGTMEKLRTITGGNIEVLLRYFPEIRAARGALALMSAEGENYNKVQKAMNDAQENGGAMQRTFNEQMKSTSAQLTLVKNNVTATAVELGTKFLPYLKDGITELRSFTSRMIELGREGQDRLEPFFKNIRPTIENVKDVMAGLAQTFGPIVTAFGALVAIGIIEFLNGLSTVIETTTGFLADHEEIVAALVTMYGVKLVGAAFMAGGAIDGLVLKMMYMQGALAKTSAVQTLVTIQTAAYGVAAAFSTAGITGAVGAASTAIYGMLTPMALVGVAAAGLVASFVMIRNENERLAQLGKNAVSEWEGSFKAADATFLGLNSHLSEINDNMHKFHEAELALKNDQSNADQAMQALGFKETKHFDEAQKALGKLQAQYGGYIEVVKEVAFQTGSTYDEAIVLIRDTGYAVEDLKNGSVDSEKKQQEAIANTIKFREESVAKRQWELSAVGATQNELTRLAGLTGEEFEAEAARIMETASAAQDFAKKVGEAWASQNDVVSALGDQVGVTGGQILKWYDTMVTNGQKFAGNIRTAIEMGYDPGLIARTLEAGPQQAGPILQAMVDNQEQSFIDSVNNAEQTLQDLNLRVVEMARLTHRATTSTSDQMVKDLNYAMQIATITMAGGGKATMDALTHQLGIGADEVRRIADEYGITLAAALDPVRSATGLSPIPRRGGARAFAEGGYIDPRVYGDTNRDSVPAWVMPGEVVIRKSSVQKAGLSNLLHINETGQLPGYAAGGAVAAARAGQAPITTPRIVDGYAPFASVKLPPPGDFPPGTMGETSKSAAHQTYLKAVAWQAAQEAMMLTAGGFGRGGGGGPAGNYTPGMMRSRADILARFGPMSVGGYANRNIAGTNTRSAHGMWRAFDFMVGLGNVAKGNAISSFLQTNAGQYGLKGLIWNAMSNYGGGWKPYRHPGGGTNPTLMHRDHVHAEYYRKGGLVRKTYDQGGWLMPGDTLAQNHTGQPERILSPQESRRDMMPAIALTANVTVYVGTTQIRDIVRQEISVSHDKRDRASRSMATVDG